MKRLKKKIFKFRRVFQELLLFKKNYYNWDGILKRLIIGKKTTVLRHKKGVNFYKADNNTLSIVREIFINNVYANNIIVISEGDVFL